MPHKLQLWQVWRLLKHYFLPVLTNLLCCKSFRFGLIFSTIDLETQTLLGKTSRVLPKRLHLRDLKM